MSCIKQRRPFTAIIPDHYKRMLVAQAENKGCHYGIFFDTSGRVRTERINPTAQYNYLFRTDEQQGSKESVGDTASQSEEQDSASARHRTGQGEEPLAPQGDHRPKQTEGDSTEDRAAR
jgi:hypothetical protein